ncbi:MAG TPA: DUF885 domain-containing protein [Gammaproteobacteria bacterium]|nr:DUF885 domain-containing protein [Gammaproteobacteria bacterium]
MSEGQAAFRTLVDDYYRAWFRFHPEAAVDVGVEGYSHLLRPYGDDDHGALVALQEKLLAALDEVDVGELDADAALDYEVLHGAALLEHHELIERDWRYRDPTAYVPVNAIYQLTLRPVADPGAALEARLGAIPGYLRGARTHLSASPEAIPPLWVEAAVAESRSGVEYLRALHRHPEIERLHLDRPLDEAAHALEDFAHYLEREIAPRAGGEVACGRAHYERLLRYRHFLDIDADRLHALGRRLYDTTLAELKAVTRELRGDEDIAAMSAELPANYPAGGDLVDSYRREMEAARAYVAEHGLVSLPDVEQLRVVETPVFLRHQIPFAAYLEPTPTDPHQRGLYYVTPAADEVALAEHNRVSQGHTCVHEAWPGHHLQFVTANRARPSSTLPRLLNPSATLYEGWALYCEQLMVEEGFLSEPASRFVLLKDRLWRALRIMIDVELHCRGLSVEAAIERMSESLGFTPTQARGELTWYSLAPSVPMGYATGWALINAARTRLRAVEPGLSLRDFHDRLLGAGSVGLPLVIRSNFGAPFWDSVAREVFDASAVEPN